MFIGANKTYSYYFDLDREHSICTQCSMAPFDYFIFNVSFTLEKIKIYKLVLIYA